MKSELLPSIISAVTEKAYRNYHDWLPNDADIASQLRDGIRMARSAFEEIEPNGSRKAILAEMKEKVQKCLAYYRTLPGEAGVWECSALNIITGEIERIHSGQ